MTSTPTLTMYDAINAANLPASGTIFAGYIDGRFADWTAIRKRFPHARVFSIAVFASDDAECLDVESGDATIAEIYGWFKAQQARGQWRPCVYSSVSNINQIVATMTANGFSRGSYRLWSAHYGSSLGAHICGPATCGLCNTACDGTQWTDHSNLYDISMLQYEFFNENPPPAPMVWKWVPWTTAGQESMVEFAANAGLPVSTWLKAQPQLDGGDFTAYLSQYLQAGDLTVKFAAGEQVWNRVKVPA